ncbi:hypothetical protein C2138_11565 [Salinibacterium hongtaonis]|nr:hypothetical protein C2138_11565 [Salinibacterium hongtaonis]
MRQARLRNFGIVLAAAAMALAMVGCAPAEEVPVVPELTSGEESALTTAALDEHWAAILAEFPNAVRPVVDKIRFVTLDEWPTVSAKCRTDEGFPASGEGGGVSQHVPEGQEEATEIATYRCAAKYPVDPRFTVALNDSQMSFLYKYFLDTLTPCLEDEGYEIAQAPSFQSFSSSFGTADGWTPYSDVMSTVEDWEELNAKCPQDPERLYG